LAAPCSGSAPILAVAFPHGHPLDLDLAGNRHCLPICYIWTQPFFAWSIDGVTAQPRSRLRGFLTVRRSKQGLFRRM
jgi:hypothetical protein